MPQCCSVPLCSKKKGGHKFPRDKDRLKQWLVAIRRNFTPSKNSLVCKEHFTKDDFELPKDSVLDEPRLVLKKTAVPSQFPWNDPDYDPLVHKKKLQRLRRLDRKSKKRDNMMKQSLIESSNKNYNPDKHKQIPDIGVQRFNSASNSEAISQNSETVEFLNVTIKLERVSDEEDNVPSSKGSEQELRVPKTEPAEDNSWEVPIAPIVYIKCENESDPENDEQRSHALDQLPPVKSEPVKSEPVEHDVEQDDAAQRTEPMQREQAAENANVQQTQQSRDDATTAPGNKRYECTVCRKCFSGSQALKAHSRRHTGEKPYGCNDCQRQFTDRSSLRRHLKTHTGEKPFECSVCQHRFSEKSQLLTHSRTHTGEKPYECTVCQRRFTDKSTLQRHVRTHTGEKPFECDICQRRFNQNSSLRTHFLTHTREKSHKCNICYMQFANKQYLEIHSRVHLRGATLAVVPTWDG